MSVLLTTRPRFFCRSFQLDLAWAYDIKKIISFVTNAQWMSKAISTTCAARALHGARRTRGPRIPTYYCILFMLKLEKFILALTKKEIKRIHTYKKYIFMNVIKFGLGQGALNSRTFSSRNAPLQVLQN